MKTSCVSTDPVKPLTSHLLAARWPLALGLGFLLAADPVPACQETNPQPAPNSRALFAGYQKDHGVQRNKTAAFPPGERHGAAALRTAKEDCFFYANLRSENEVPCLSPLVRKYNELPKKTRLVETTRNGRMVKLAVIQAGSGTHDRVMVCIPGVMGDHQEWRFVVGALADDYDFWLIDPPGCGESDAPAPKALGADGYSPTAMADRELQAVAACLTDCQRQVRLVMVAHSLGGLVGIRAFADPSLRERHAQTLARFEGLVALAPADVLMPEANRHFQDMAVLSGTKVGAAQGLGLLRELVAGYLAKGFYSSRCLPREDVDAAVHVIRGKGHRRAFQAMLREALPFDLKTGQPDLAEMQRLESWYRNVDVPVQIIWGNCDQTLPVHLGYKIAAQLPNAKLTVLPNCKHAPNQECPEECARLMRQAELALRTQNRPADERAVAGVSETQTVIPQQGLEEQAGDRENTSL